MSTGTKKGRIVLVLGGARSGKSVFAESLIDISGLTKCYLATGQVLDDEMHRRVDVHKKRRGQEWELAEEPLNLSTALGQVASERKAVLVDCLTLWVSNLMLAERDLAQETDDLVHILETLRGTIVLVSNEVGLGIVPDNAMARAFRDHAGLLHQKVAAVADDVYFVTAGLPQKFKG
jgi:adenosylcobinamide kinase / adenosylcobinamide-phosphate guanylyltransferase